MDTHKPLIQFYPAIQPFAQGMLDVGDGHQIFWEQSGNPKGLPVVFIHGGPGAGTSPLQRRFFNPDRYRIILFDQRGAGRSIPFACTEANTTNHLINDMEKLRRHLNIDQWLLFGGSWGSTLALAYAIEHTTHCLGLILRGIFLGRQVDLDWFLYGSRTIFPDAWADFSNFLDPHERDDLLKNYHMRLMSHDPDIHLPAAAAWNRFETDCSTLMGFSHQGGRTKRDPAIASHRGLAIARIEIHFFHTGVFSDDNYILNTIHNISALPGTIVQGRYDMVCPIVGADALAQLWPLADYQIITEAGHSALEPGIVDALVSATDNFVP